MPPGGAAAAYGDYLVERPGEARLRTSGVAWALTGGGPPVPYDEYWSVRWDGDTATVSTTGEPRLTSHVTCRP